MSSARPQPRVRWPLVIGLLLVLCAPATAQDEAVENLYREGQRLARSDPAAALREYQLLVDQFPDHPLAPAALLRMVEIFEQQGDERRRDLKLKQLLDGYGRSPEAARGYLIESAIRRRQARTPEDLEQVRAMLRRVPLLFDRDAFPRLPARAEARVAAGEISRALDDPASAAADFLLVIEDEPPSAVTKRAQRLLAETLIDRDQWLPASEILQRLLDEPAADEAPAEEERGRAGRLLTLLHRRLVRPLAGEPFWAGTRAFAQGLQLKSASGVAAHEDGRLVVTDDGLPVIAVVAPSGEVEMRTDLRGLGRPLWDGDRPGALAGDAVLRPFGGPTTKFKAPAKDATLKGLVAVERGLLGDRYVVARSQTGVLRYSSARRSTELLAAGRPEFTDLARDGRGRIYALDRRGRKVQRIGLDRRPEGTVASGEWKRAEALAVDRLGFVFVLDRGNRQVLAYDPAGRLLATAGPQLDGGLELRAPVDLAVDGSGRVFVADAKLPFLVVIE
ncbi:MAG: hypothetical protein D6696_21190 [Acidobacteria bacterium]|nr:MAG: hypothetical protein D6696_21190 [Acidobacteriota bacterium]